MRRQLTGDHITRNSINPADHELSPQKAGLYKMQSPGGAFLQDVTESHPELTPQIKYVMYDLRE